MVGAGHITGNMLTPGRMEILIWIVDQTRYGIQEYFDNFKSTHSDSEKVIQKNSILPELFILAREDYNPLHF